MTGNRIQSRIATIVSDTLRLAENDGEVVRRHFDDASEREAMIAGAGRHFIQIAQPPARITVAQVFIELSVAGCDRLGRLAERAVQIESNRLKRGATVGLFSRWR